MSRGISVRKANADVIQVGILEYALNGTPYKLGKPASINKTTDNGMLLGPSGKRIFRIINDDSEHVAIITALNTSTLEAIADDRPTYRILTDIFKIATIHGQKCTIQKNFVEVCDFSIQKESKISKLLKSIR